MNVFGRYNVTRKIHVYATPIKSENMHTHQYLYNDELLGNYHFGVNKKCTQYYVHVNQCAWMYLRILTPTRMLDITDSLISKTQPKHNKLITYVFI